LENPPPPDNWAPAARDLALDESDIRREQLHIAADRKMAVVGEQNGRVNSHSGERLACASEDTCDDSLELATPVGRKQIQALNGSKDDVVDNIIFEVPGVA